MLFCYLPFRIKVQYQDFFINNVGCVTTYDCIFHDAIMWFFGIIWRCNFVRVLICALYARIYKIHMHLCIIYINKRISFLGLSSPAQKRDVWIKIHLCMPKISRSVTWARCRMKLRSIRQDINGKNTMKRNFLPFCIYGEGN